MLLERQGACTWPKDERLKARECARTPPHSLHLFQLAASSRVFKARSREHATRLLLVPMGCGISDLFRVRAENQTAPIRWIPAVWTACFSCCTAQPLKIDCQVRDEDKVYSIPSLSPELFLSQRIHLCSSMDSNVSLPEQGARKCEPFSNSQTEGI